MNLGDKQGLDAVLKDWSPTLRGAAGSEQDDERLWDERADATVKAALEMKGASGDLDALLASPALPPEAGESGAVPRSGVNKMSDDKEGGPLGDSGSLPSLSPISIAPPGERKRTSLKEITARASQAGTRPSSPSTPAPASVASVKPPALTPLPRPVEAGKDDSGVINLNVVQASVTAQERAAAEKAQPGQAGLFEDEHTVESAVDPIEKAVVAKPTNVTVIAARKKSNSGPIAGAAIAVLGIAAAFAIISRKPAASGPVAGDSRPNVVAVAAPPPTAAATVATAAPPPPATAGATALAEAPSAAPTAEPSKGPDPVRVAGPMPTGGPLPVKEAPVDPAKGASTAVAVAPPTGKPGDLQSEMARAVGPIADKGNAGTPTPEPAAGRPSNQNIPEQPSQGSVQAAIGTVMGGAKACVTGADDISRAQVTFSSSGAVTGVSVTGWAAAHGKSGCVSAALKGAKVGPFSKSSFTVGVPIRP
jgi:hypothetical protein